MKKITRAYVTHFDIIDMIQTLPTGRVVKCEWIRDDNDRWHSNYSSNSAYHICKYSGIFKDCQNCKCYNDDAEMMSKQCATQGEAISMNEMASRATACANAKGCTINFRSSNA